MLLYRFLQGLFRFLLYKKFKIVVRQVAVQILLIFYQIAVVYALVNTIRKPLS